MPPPAAPEPLWTLAGFLLPVALTAVLLRVYRRLALGPESALAAVLALLMLAAIAARWAPESARHALATGGVGGLLASLLLAAAVIVRQRRRRGPGGRISTGEQRRRRGLAPGPPPGGPPEPGK